MPAAAARRPSALHDLAAALGRPTPPGPCPPMRRAAAAPLAAALGRTLPPAAPAGPRRFTPLPWRQLTDAEWIRIAPHLGAASTPAAPSRRRFRGRPPVDARRTADAVFWVAASPDPWRTLPQHLGKPGSIHRALSRWARDGRLEALLRACLGRETLLAGLAWYVARACRRMARLVPMRLLAALRRARLADALPAWPLRLPDPNLSKRTARLVRLAIDLPGAGRKPLLTLPQALALSADLLAQGLGMLRGWKYR
jgi:transposase